MLAHRTGVDVLLQGSLIQAGHLFSEFICGQGKVHEPCLQTGIQLLQHRRSVRPRQVHLVHEHKSRHPMGAQQMPQRGRVALHALRAADDQHRAVQHREGTLRLGGEIHMAGGVQQGQHRVGQRKHCLFGKDGDASAAFQRVGVQKGVAVVHTAGLFQPPAPVEQRFAERGLAGIHMSQDTNGDAFHVVFSPLRSLLLYCIIL